MARAMVASAYIRQLRSGLPLCCIHGLIAQEGWDYSRGRQKGLTPAANAVSQSHIRPARRAQRERRNRVCSVSCSVSWLGRRRRHENGALWNEPELNIAPERDGELACNSDNHDPFDATALSHCPFQEPSRK